METDHLGIICQEGTPNQIIDYVFEYKPNLKWPENKKLAHILKNLLRKETNYLKFQETKLILWK